MKYFLSVVVMLGAFAGGWFAKPVERVELKSSDTTYVHIPPPPPVVKWLKPAQTTEVVPRGDTVYIPIFDTVAIERDFFVNDSLQWFYSEDFYERDGDSVFVATVAFPNIYVPELELKMIQRVAWNSQSYKVVTNNLILPKPLPFVQVKPTLAVGINTRGRPDAVVGFGIVFNF